MKQEKQQKEDQGSKSGPVLLFDLEADGLLPAISQVHCMVLVEITPEVRSLACSSTSSSLIPVEKYRPQEIPQAINRLKKAGTLVGHNIIGYDLPALWKVRGGWNSVPLVLDTLVVSRFQWPERPWGHSLEGWGKHLGNEKIEFNDYETYSEEMLEYCAQDVLVNLDVLMELEKEHGSPLEGFSVYN